MSDEIKRLHAIVHGRVQGVGFRWFVMESVRELAVTGWVRNLYNGNVEVMAEGSQEDLDKLVKSLHKGPPSSNVTNVDDRWQPASGDFSGFKVKMDA